jgi:hypothetical protein
LKRGLHEVSIAQDMRSQSGVALASRCRRRCLRTGYCTNREAPDGSCKNSHQSQHQRAFHQGSFSTTRHDFLPDSRRNATSAVRSSLPRELQL